MQLSSKKFKKNAVLHKIILESKKCQNRSFFIYVVGQFTRFIHQLTAGSHCFPRSRSTTKQWIDERIRKQRFKRLTRTTRHSFNGTLKMAEGGKQIRFFIVKNHSPTNIVFFHSLIHVNRHTRCTHTTTDGFELNRFARIKV